MKERVVYLYQNTTTHLLAGDEDLEGGTKGEILPHLLKTGWEIRETVTTGTAAAADFPTQVIAIMILEKAGDG